jgi:predicted transcriptional regulator
MRRGRLERTVSILHGVRNAEQRTFSGKKQLPISVLASQARLAFNDFTVIVEALLKQGLIETIPISKVKSSYRLTIEGRDWLKQFDALMNILEIPSIGMPS